MNTSLREYRIKVISTFFEGDYNEEVSNKILNIIDNYSLDYTLNNNGIFINLNVIDDFLLDIIYDCIKSNYNLSGNSDNDYGLFDNITTPIINDDLHPFNYSVDSINYANVDMRLLSLSKDMLTI